MKVTTVLAALTILVPGAMHAQRPQITGRWQAQWKEGPEVVVIRDDSTASYRKETVRWRWGKAQDQVMLALGGEWVTYRVRVNGASLTLSEGDLQKPVSMKKLGPPTPRPDSVPVPPDPDTESP